MNTTEILINLQSMFPDAIIVLNQPQLDKLLHDCGGMIIETVPNQYEGLNLKFRLKAT